MNAQPPRLAMPAPGLELSFTITVMLGEAIERGVYDNQRHRTIPIVGGAVEGPGFAGRLVSGGADWQTVRVSDGTARIYARYTLQHEDGTFVSVINPGVRRGPADVLARVGAGEAVDPALYYFRSAPQFEAPPGAQAWLSENIFVGVGARRSDSVVIDVYRVL